MRARRSLAMIARLIVTVLAFSSLAAAQGAEGPTLEVYKARYRFASELEPHVRAALTADGRVSVDQATNSLVMIDRPANLAIIRGLLQTLDARPRMVRIESRFVAEEDLAREAAQVRWDVNLGGVRIGTAPLARPGGGGGAAVAVSLEGEKSGRRETSSASLLLESGKEGFIQAGADVPVPAGPPGRTVAYAATGTGFAVKPIVMDDTHIRVSITPRQSRPSPALPGAIESAGASTEVVVAPGEQIVIGSVGTDSSAGSSSLLAGGSREGSRRRLILLLTARIEEEGKP